MKLFYEQIKMMMMMNLPDGRASPRQTYSSDRVLGLARKIDSHISPVPSNFARGKKFRNLSSIFNPSRV